MSDTSSHGHYPRPRGPTVAAATLLFALMLAALVVLFARIVRNPPPAGPTIHRLSPPNELPPRPPANLPP